MLYSDEETESAPEFKTKKKKKKKKTLLPLTVPVASGDGLPVEW